MKMSSAFSRSVGSALRCVRRVADLSLLLLKRKKAGRLKKEERDRHAQGAKHKTGDGREGEGSVYGDKGRG